MRGLLVVSLSLLSAGCWSPRYFTPRENLNGTGPDGHPSAVYAVRAGDTAPGDTAPGQGEVRLWSGGAKVHYDEDDREVVDLHVGFELENTSDAPLEIDIESLHVAELYLDGRLQGDLTRHSVTGNGQAAPGQTARVDVVFRPAASYPSEVDSFSVRFAVRDGQDQWVEQVTPFVPGRPWRSRLTAHSPLGFSRYGWGGLYGGYGWWRGPFDRGIYCR
jgi:hypothetical protein